VADRDRRGPYRRPVSERLGHRRWCDHIDCDRERCTGRYADRFRPVADRLQEHDGLGVVRVWNPGLFGGPPAHIDTARELHAAAWEHLRERPRLP
jgi:hypothetical protein